MQMKDRHTIVSPAFLLGMLGTLILSTAGLTLRAQHYINDSAIVVEAIVENGDTLAIIELDEIPVYQQKVFKNKRHRRQYTRLMRNVKKAYPFAIIARTELKKLNDTLIYIEDKKAQKEFIKQTEKNMFNAYEGDLRQLTFTQGRIMLKLVDREIGNTPYELIQEYRGSISAVFWQGIARIFKNDLKAPYDPLGEDAEIEEIVQLLEAGLI